MTLEFQALAWDMSKHVAVQNRLRESQPIHLNNWLSNDNAIVLILYI
jgi:hypothetical protein